MHERPRSSAVSPLRCALRAFADPDLAEGAGPPTRRGQESPAVRRLLHVLFSTRVG
ncbi:MAG: hypothetical protein H7287_14705 [Thermoleophilia bacterium]|nr:hypothetical protein [Thermoleophilia bacterium]